LSPKRDKNYLKNIVNKQNDQGTNTA